MVSVFSKRKVAEMTRIIQMWNRWSGRLTSNTGPWRYFTGKEIQFSHSNPNATEQRPSWQADTVLPALLKKFSFFMFYTAHCNTVFNDNQENAQMIYIFSVCSTYMFRSCLTIFKCAVTE
jgi:hypothetical protein